MAGITVAPITVAAKAVLPRIIRSDISAPPSIKVFVTFSGGVETDITADVQRVTITRGRNKERETMSPGRAEIVILNFNGKYDPDNFSSPYYPNIRPNKPVRIIANTDTGTVPLFDGRLEGSTLNFAEGGLQPTVLWRAIDASKRLNRDRSTTGYGTAGQKTGARVAAVLNGATPPWPVTERYLGAGTKTVQFSAGDQGRYDYLVQVAESEPGAFFIAADGKAIFRDATWAPTPAQPALGNAVGEYKFSSIEITDDESEIYNAVTVTANAIPDEVQEDISSQAEFGRSDLSVSSLLDTSADMDSLAFTYLVAYSSPRRRVSSLKVDRVAADWYWFLSKELMDRVTVRHRPIYGGTFSQTSAIQGITLAVNDSQNWELTWNLSPPLDVISNPNLLTPNQSSIETDASGWYVSFTENPPGNGVIITGRTAGPYAAYVGDYGLEFHSYGVPQIQGAIRTTPYTTAAVIPAHTYRASAWIRDAGWLTDYWYIRIFFYNSGGSVISNTENGPFGPYYSGSSEWQQGTVEAVAPTNAAYAAVELVVVETHSPSGGGHIYFVDAVELRDTLVLASINPQPSTIARAVVMPAPTILTTPQNRTVTPATIARAAALPAPTVTGGTAFVPTDISGLVGWYDFTDLSKLWQSISSATTAVTADSQPIGYVQDKSAGTHDLQANTTANRPLVRTGANGINGKAIAQFDGTDDALFTSTFTADASITYFIVAKKRSAPSSTNRILVCTSNGTDWVYTQSTISAAGYVYDTDEVGASRILGGTATNVNVIVLRYNSGSSADYWINGGAKANFDPENTYGFSSDLCIGADVALATGFGDFNVGEYIRYNSALTLTDINRVGPYLATRFGFTWTTAT
jgi:hypothetical protein